MKRHSGSVTMTCSKLEDCKTHDHMSGASFLHAYMFRFSITCGLYVNIILGDYLRTILNLNDNPTDSDWRLDPREAFSNVFDSEGTPKGVGNQVSAEFNFIYRWHCATSNRDEAWINEFMGKIYGKDVDISKYQRNCFTDGIVCKRNCSCFS